MSYMFSIVIPIYNVEKYLCQCIESAINQTYRNIEIILVDDGSPDSSPVLCDEYARKEDRIKVIHKKNGGLVSARQAGVSLATGDYIINLDGDDWLALDYCEKMADIVEQYHPDMIMCGYYKAYEDSEVSCPMTYRDGFYDREKIEKEIFPILIQNKYGYSFNLSLWAKATISSIQRSEQLAVDSRITVGEDSVCTIPCFYRTDSLYILNSCLYYYRQNQASMTKNKSVYAWNGPEIRGKHIEKRIDVSQFNFQEQMYRSVTHSVFTVVKSQFNDKKRKIKEIKRDIREKLDNSYYLDAIRKSSFSGLKANLMKYSLQYRWLWMIRLFNRK